MHPLALVATLYGCPPTTVVSHARLATACCCRVLGLDTQRVVGTIIGCILERTPLGGVVGIPCESDLGATQHYRRPTQ